MKDILIPIGDLLSQSFEIVKNSIAGFLGITLIPILINMAFAIITVVIFIIVLVAMGIGGLFNNPSAHMAQLLPVIIAGIIGFGVMVLIMGVIQSWGSLALIHYVLGSDQNITIRTAFKKSLSQILSFWWLSFLMGFVMMGGFLLFIVPGIIFYLWFIFATFIFVAENEKGLHAMQKSREYVRGFAGEIFARLVVLVVVNIGAQSVISTIVKFIPHSDKQFGLIIMLACINVLFSVLVSAFSMVYLSLMYRSVKEAKKDMVFTPSSKANWLYIGVGIGGIVLTIAFFTFIIFALSSLGNSMNSRKYKANPYMMDNSGKYNDLTPTPFESQNYYTTPSPIGSRSATPSSRRTGEL